MKIACTIRLSEHQRKLVEAVSGRIELLFPEIRYETGSPYFPTIVDSRVKDCEVLLGHINPRGLAEAAPALRWIHLFSAGVDHVLKSEQVAQRRVVLTNSSGTTAPWIGEYVMGVMLQRSRGLALSMRAQLRHEWFHQTVRGVCHSLRGKTLGIIGYGSIGRAAAHLAQALGMEVLALKRDPSAHRDPGWSLPGLGDPDGQIPSRWFGPEERLGLLTLSDYILMTLPLTPETRHFLRAREFATAKPDAYLINVARGEVIDQAALVEALNKQQLGGACLDVTTPEPLDSASPLWDMENVALTFHTSAARPLANFYDLACELFAENLCRHMNGTELLNVIDPARGY